MDIRCKDRAYRGRPMTVGDETVQVPDDGIFRDVSKELAAVMLGMPAFFEAHGAAAPAKPKAKAKKSESAKSAPKKTGVLKRMGRALSGEGEV